MGAEVCVFDYDYKSAMCTKELNVGIILRLIFIPLFVTQTIAVGLVTTQKSLLSSHKSKMRIVHRITGLS